MAFNRNNGTALKTYKSTRYELVAGGRFLLHTLDFKRGTMREENLAAGGAGRPMSLQLNSGGSLHLSPTAYRIPLVD